MACVNRAGVAVAETIVEQLAASESVLTDDEKELGVALVDIGGGTTDIAIYERGSLWHTAVIGVGGDTLESKGARIILNGLPLAEPYAVRSSVDGQYSPWLVQFDRMTVPSGKFFVMGDDRDLSWDSRSSDFGPVGAESFRAKALYICWSSTYSRIGKRLE